MSVTLRKLCEIANAREFYKNPLLRSIVPKIWDDNATVKLPHLSIVATPTGEERVWRTGIYDVQIAISVEGKPRKHTINDYLAEVDKIFFAWSQLDQPGFEKLFMPYGVYVHGAIVRRNPASLEGSSRVESSAITFVAHALSQ